MKNQLFFNLNPETCCHQKVLNKIFSGGVVFLVRINGMSQPRFA